METVKIEKANWSLPILLSLATNNGSVNTNYLINEIHISF